MDSIELTSGVVFFVPEGAPFARPSRPSGSGTRLKAAFLERHQNGGEKASRWIIGLACGVPGRAARASREARLRTDQSVSIIRTENCVYNISLSLSSALVAHLSPPANAVAPDILNFTESLWIAWTCGGLSRTERPM